MWATQLLPNVIRKSTPNEHKYLLVDPKTKKTIKVISVPAIEFRWYATDVSVIKELCWINFNPNEQVAKDTAAEKAVDAEGEAAEKEIEQTWAEKIDAAKTKEEEEEAKEEIETLKKETKAETKVKKWRKAKK